MEKLLSVIEENPRLTNEEIAVMLNRDVQSVTDDIKALEDSGIIKGYRAMIDREKIGSQTVTAFIEIKVQPKIGHGFEEIASRIAEMEEVETVFLMSGGFDLACMVTDKSFKEVAMFVAKRLSPMDSVVSTATHFILKKYKEHGVLYIDDIKDDRGIYSF